MSSPSDMLIDAREKGREGEREGNTGVREKYQLVVSRVRPKQGPNPQPFVLQTMLQPTEPHWPELVFFLIS